MAKKAVVKTDEQELPQDERKFLQMWWNAEHIEDVVDALKIDDPEKYEGRTKKNIIITLRNKARQYRIAGVPMKYLHKKERATRTKKEIDAKSTLAYLKKMGISQKDLNAAKKAEDEAKAMTDERIGR
jgi:hypothetical protein